MVLNKDVFGNRPKLGILIDPDHERDHRFSSLLGFLSESQPDIVLVGGSHLEKNNTESVVCQIKSSVRCPVVLFPGSEIQIVNNADAIFLPSLISGRNAEYLIGKHVKAASRIVQSNVPVFPMGYILIDGGHVSTTSLVTQSKPICKSDKQLILDTALAGQLLGMKCIYLEAGSGAKNSVPLDIIYDVKNAINIPLIVGGGITEENQLISAVEAGADMVVLGTILEERPEKFLEFSQSFSSRVPS